MDVNFWLILEIISFALNIIFIILLTREKKACWIYGTLGSLTGALLMFHNNYLSESALYIFYAVIGAYALYVWERNKNSDFSIKKMPNWIVGLILILGLVGAWFLGWLSEKMEGDKPYFDGLSSSFGIIATFLELYKFLVAWIFWVFINAYSVWLYLQNDLYIYATQMVIFTILSVLGFVTWSKKVQS